MHLPPTLTAAGIRDGDPETVAMLCLATGSGVLAYCERAGAPDAASVTVAAFAAFRRRLVDAGDSPAGTETVLLSAVRDAVHKACDPPPTSQALQNASHAYTGARQEPLPPRLARDVIRAIVDAAPVQVHGGDSRAVREKAERRYAGEPIHTGDDESAPGETDPAAANRWIPRQLAEVRTSEPAPEDERSVWRVPPSTISRPAMSPNTPTAFAAVSAHVPELAPLPERPAALSDLAVRPSRRAGWLVWVGGAVALGAAMLGAYIGVSPESSSDEKRASSSEGKVVMRERLREPFDLAGARFEVAPASSAPWARALRRQSPRLGHRWVTLTVRTRNLSRNDFRPRSLRYRLITRAGVVIGPDVAEQVEPVSPSGSLARGKRSSVHLGFQVPGAQRALTLAFEPYDSRPPGVRVTVGAG